MNVLITGAGGFLGRNVARHFALLDHSVVGVGRGYMSPADAEQMGLAEWHSGSLDVSLLLQSGQRPDLIVHCAGSGTVARSHDEPFDSFIDTVRGTAVVLEFARSHAPTARFIYPSSPAVQGLHDNTPFRPTDPVAPASTYGFQKAMAESLCSNYRVTYGLRINIVRFFSVYGEGLRKQLLWDACKKLTSGNCADFWGDGCETRDWVHVDDAAELLVKIARARYEGLPEVLNCGSGKSHTTRSVVEHLRELLGASATVHFNGHIRQGDPQHYVADISKSLALGWCPKVTIEEGLRRYVEWFRRAT